MRSRDPSLLTEAPPPADAAPFFTFIAADGAEVPLLPAALSPTTAAAHSLYLGAALDVGETEGLVPVALAPTVRTYVAYLNFREALHRLDHALSAEANAASSPLTHLQGGKEEDAMVSCEHWRGARRADAVLRGSADSDTCRAAAADAAYQHHRLARPLRCDCGRLQQSHQRLGFDFHSRLSTSPVATLATTAIASERDSEGDAAERLPLVGPGGERYFPPLGSSSSTSRASFTPPSPPLPSPPPPPPPPPPATGETDGEEDGLGAAADLASDWELEAAAAEAVEAAAIHDPSQQVTTAAITTTAAATAATPRTDWGKHEAEDSTQRRGDTGAEKRAGAKGRNVSSQRTQCAGYDLREAVPDPMDAFFIERIALQQSTGGAGPASALLYDATYYRPPARPAHRAPATSAFSASPPPPAPATAWTAPPLAPLALSSVQQHQLLSLVTLADFLGDEHLTLVCGRYLACWLANATEAEVLAAFSPDSGEHPTQPTEDSAECDGARDGVEDRQQHRPPAMASGATTMKASWLPRRPTQEPTARDVAAASAQWTAEQPPERDGRKANEKKKCCRSGKKNKKSAGPATAAPSPSPQLPQSTATDTSPATPPALAPLDNTQARPQLFLTPEQRMALLIHMKEKNGRDVASRY